MTSSLVPTSSSKSSISLKTFFDCDRLGIAHLDAPPIAGTYVGKRLVIVAGGRCVWDDLERLGIKGAENNGWDVMTVNDITMHYPGKIEHLYSNDSKMIDPWLRARRAEFVREFGQPKHTHSCVHGKAATWKWPWPGHGTSTLGATYSGLGLGYDQIVICGAPLDDSGHYFDSPFIVEHNGHVVGQSKFIREVPTREDRGGLAYWSNASKMFRGKVKSMSGRTREVLGGP